MATKTTRAARTRFLRASFLPAVGLLVVASCTSSDGGNASGKGGMDGGAGTTGHGGTTGSGGTGGVMGVGGTTGTAGTAGVAGTGGATGGMGVAGSGGQSGSSGSGGAGQDGGGGGSTGGGGAMSCSGQALSLSANGSGTGTSGPNSDAAAARVDVDFGNSADLPVGNSNRTIEFWAFVPSSSWVGNANTMFFYGSTARPAHGFGLDFGTYSVSGMPGNHATLDPYTNGGFDGDSTNDIGLMSNKDQWVHFAMTWDGTALRTFVNGKEVITSKVPGDQNTTALNTDRSPIAIGGYEQDGNYFNGLIDEFRVWNVAHTADQITATMNKTLVGNEPGLVLYMKFDETSGTTAADSVTSPGHMPHNGVLKSAKNMLPAFVPSMAPVSCP